MEENMIRVQSNTRYIINVNDNGDVISFDLSDTKLPAKLFKMYSEVDRVTKKYEALAEMRKNAVSGRKKAGSNVISEDQYAAANILDAFYTEARAALDLFLGENACQKIFGDDNYYNMFNNLLGQLEPHFKKMGLDTSSMQKLIASKYMPKESGRALT